MSIILAEHPNSINDVAVSMSVMGEKAQAFTNKSVAQTRQMVFINPTSSIPSNVLSGNQTIDFRFENNIDRISSVYLRVLLSNTSGANFVCGIPETWISNIEIYANNGSKLLYQSVNNLETYLINNFFTGREEHENTTALRATNANYATGVITVLNNESRYFYVSISQQFWRSLHLSPYCLDGNILIRLKFGTSGSIIQSGTCNSPEALLVISGYNEPEHTKKYKLSQSLVPKLLSYYSPQRHREQLNLAASQKYQIRLSGIRGYANCIMFLLRSTANANSPNLQFSFDRPASFDLLDSSNKSVTGFKTQLETDIILMYSHLFPNLFINNTNASIWSFSQSPMQDITTGSVSGCIYFDGFYNLEFTTKSTLVAGAFEVISIAMCNETLEITNASMTTTRT